jgi:hypothetical protein
MSVHWFDFPTNKEVFAGNQTFGQLIIIELKETGKDYPHGLKAGYLP